MKDTLTYKENDMDLGCADNPCKGLFDCHMHVGRIHDCVFTPEYVARSILRLGLAGCALFATPGMRFEDGLSAIQAVERIVGSSAKIRPVLLIPHKQSTRSEIINMLKTHSFAAFKIHGYEGWLPNGKALRTVMDVAVDYKMPVILHTGGNRKVDAAAYARLLSRYPQVKVCLAHGRPTEQALFVMAMCPSTFVDTSFMPVASIKRFVIAGFSHRILLGSDFPADKVFFPRSSPVSRYRKRIIQLNKSFGHTLLASWGGQCTEKFFRKK